MSNPRSPQTNVKTITTGDFYPSKTITVGDPNHSKIITIGGYHKHKTVDREPGSTPETGNPPAQIF